MLRIPLKPFVMVSACLCIFPLYAEKARHRPNIIFFLVDDMGWMDTTVYGSRYYETPNMERFARQAMKFTNAYTANPLCSPTRASLMSGKYPARLHFTSAAGHLPPLAPDAPIYGKAAPVKKVLLPITRRFLPPEEYTIAEALRDAGYRTAHLGKWHLGVRPEHWPEAQGFQVSFHGAPDPGPRSYFSPYQFRAGTVTDGPEGEYITDRLTLEAIKFIKANRDRPFFLNLWHYAVHGPWGHKEEITKTFVGKKDPRGKQGNPIMASMFKSVDESLGRILDTLEELGLADNTIVIFFSDNGGNVHSNTDTDTKSRRAPKGSRRLTLLQDWRKWAGGLPPTNNYPLRSGKASIFEGGTRVPLMVKWPGAVQAGSVCDKLVMSTDFYPTLLEMAGVQKKKGKVLDGRSIVPLLRQEGKWDRDKLFCYFPHGFGKRSPAGAWVRKGDWKLIRVMEKNKYFPDDFMLYNLKEDLSETNNLAANMPAKVKELDVLLDQFFKDTGAWLPKINPLYDPKVAALSPWVNKFCEVEARDGILYLDAKKPNAFLATASLKHSGPAGLRFRARSESGERGRIQWRTANEKKFVKGHFVPFDLPADGQWHEVEVKVPAKGLLIHVRLYPSNKSGKAEIDWIRLEDSAGKVEREWNFDPVDF